MSPNWFVAWPVTGAADWLAALDADAPPGLRFSHPDDLHVTLAFLGEFEPRNEKKIASLLRGLPFAEIEATPSQLVALPQARRFSALAFTFDKGRLELEKQIARWRDRVCREAGARLETRPPLPHLTVARPERRITSDGRDDALAWAESLPAPTAVLTLLPPRIYTWDPTRKERQFLILGESPAR